MSKFFKWLKKDKDQEEPLVVQENSEQESTSSAEQAQIKNENSENKPAKAAAIGQVNEANTEQTVDSIETQSSDTEQHTNIVTEEPSVETTPENSQSHSLADTAEQETAARLAEPEVEVINTPPPSEPEEKAGFFSKLKRGLARTKESIGSGFVSLFRGKSIDDELFEELETQLLVADVGMNTTVKIINQLTETSNRKQLKDGEALYQLLKEQMTDILTKVDSPLTLTSPEGPFVILMVGVNGVGKTTTIGKMAKQFQQQGKKVMLAAGDTFRAAAVEQLQVWGERNDIPVVAQQTGSDSASVIFDAFQSAKAKNVDVLIADTAGRLQNKEHLMEELKKVVRVMKRIAPDAPHEIMLTLDAGTGQNAVSQTKLFHEAVGLTGISLTKLDGTAKGGVIFAIADQFDIPIRYVGIGEGIDDLRPFASKEFVDALFTEPENQSE